MQLTQLLVAVTAFTDDVLQPGLSSRYLKRPKVQQRFYDDRTITELTSESLMMNEPLFPFETPPFNTPFNQPLTAQPTTTQATAAQASGTHASARGGVARSSPRSQTKKQDLVADMIREHGEWNDFRRQTADWLPNNGAARAFELAKASDEIGARSSAMSSMPLARFDASNPIYVPSNIKFAAAAGSPNSVLNSNPSLNSNPGPNLNPGSNPGPNSNQGSRPGAGKNAAPKRQGKATTQATQAVGGGAPHTDFAASFEAANVRPNPSPPAALELAMRFTSGEIQAALDTLQLALVWPAVNPGSSLQALPSAWPEEMVQSLRDTATSARNASPSDLIDQVFRLIQQTQQAGPANAFGSVTQRSHSTTGEPPLSPPAVPWDWDAYSPPHTQHTPTQHTPTQHTHHTHHTHPRDEEDTPPAPVAIPDAWVEPPNSRRFNNRVFEDQLESLREQERGWSYGPPGIHPSPRPFGDGSFDEFGNDEILSRIDPNTGRLHTTATGHRGIYPTR